MDGVSSLVRAFARRTLLRRALRPVAAFAAVVFVGVAGFNAVAGVGVVDALFWLLDPTSIELHFQSHDGPATLVKGYAIVVLSGLVVASLWIGETLLSATFGGQIHEELRQMKTERRIDDLEAHVVVCGYGTFGRTIATHFRDAGRDIVVVERQETQYRRAIDDGVLAVRGDARREEPLGEAGIERASSVVGAIDDTTTNIKIAVVASRLAPTVRLVVRAGDQTDEAIARRVGADRVIVPEVTSGEQIGTEL